MRKLLKVLCTATVVLLLIAAFAILASASDFDVSKNYFVTSGQSEAFFADKSADSAVTRGEAAQFLEAFVKKSASQGIIAQKNADKSFADGTSAVSTVYKYGAMIPSDGTKFGTAEKATYAEFLSAWLTILGYSAEAGDFLFEFPYDCAGRIGIISSVSSGHLTFERMLEVSVRAIGANFKGKSFPLVSSAQYGETVKNISPSAANAPFMASLGNSTLLPLGNVCGDSATVDSRFDVSVSRGNDEIVLDTYKLNTITASGNTPDSVVSGKRYSAFCFSGAVTVNVKLGNDVSSYNIYSSDAGYSHTFNDGTLSITLSKAQNLRVRFNGNVEQEIFIFACGMSTSLSASDIKGVTVNGNATSSAAESEYSGKIYINQYKLDLKTPAYFSAKYGTLVNAVELCEYFGLDRDDYDFGRQVYIDGKPYVVADEVNSVLGFEECIVDKSNHSVKYVDRDYTFLFDALDLNSASNANLALSEDESGNLKLSQKKSGFGGLIANVTKAYGLSNGSLALDFDALASSASKIKTTLIARGEVNQSTSKEFSLTGDLRRCSVTFTLDGVTDLGRTEIYLVISPADTSYPSGMTYTVASHTLTREEFYQQTQLVIYPEYPEKVNRIYDYKVTVTQGDRTEQLPVYNHTMWVREPSAATLTAVSPRSPSRVIRYALTSKCRRTLNAIRLCPRRWDSRVLSTTA